MYFSALCLSKPLIVIHKNVKNYSVIIGLFFFCTLFISLVRNKKLSFLEDWFIDEEEKEIGGK